MKVFVSEWKCEGACCGGGALLKTHLIMEKRKTILPNLILWKTILPFPRTDIL